YPRIAFATELSRGAASAALSAIAQPVRVRASSRDAFRWTPTTSNCPKRPPSGKSDVERRPTKNLTDGIDPRPRRHVVRRASARAHNTRDGPFQDLRTRNRWSPSFPCRNFRNDRSHLRGAFRGPPPRLRWLGEFVRYRLPRVDVVPWHTSGSRLTSGKQ